LEVGKRTRLDPRREATQTALIEAAEMMFAGAGVDGISTRQIGAAIGSLNTNVVAYHFGSKHALIDAIFRHRLSAIDRRRAALLIEADKDRSAESIHGLMRVFALPLFEQVNAQGQHSFARFNAGVERSGQIAARGRMSTEFPETEVIIARIAALLPNGLSHATCDGPHHICPADNRPGNFAR
jgi:AcrR family transcriptional regulator